MFDICHITHIRRGENIRADALAGLADLWQSKKGKTCKLQCVKEGFFFPSTHTKQLLNATEWLEVGFPSLNLRLATGGIRSLIKLCSESYLKIQKSG
ncbi:hypothetical protein AAC387_Pa01g2130 [Persea americana]